MRTRRARSRRSAAAAVALAAALGIAGCSAAPDDPGADTASGAATPTPMAVQAPGAPDEVRIGLVVSLTSAPGEGADWASAADGARLAAYRYGLAGQKVTLIVVDDKGTAKGAAAAVRKLAGQGVAGTVLATTGSHTEAALTAAASANTTVLAPYQVDADELTQHAWSTGVTDQSAGRALTAYLTSHHLKPVVIDAGGAAVTVRSAAARLRSAPGKDAGAAARAALKAISSRRANRANSVVVAGDAAALGRVVTKLQGAGITQPIITTGAATSPAFAAALEEDGGTVNASLTSVGANLDDSAALQKTADGQALTAFMAAATQAGAVPGVKTAVGDRPFSRVASVADVPSHDAVVALVAAAAKVHSTDPTAVSAVMPSLRVTHADGLAGPGLDFSRRQARSAEVVMPLQSTSQNPGLRPDSDTPRLYWFAAPTRG